MAFLFPRPPKIGVCYDLVRPFSPGTGNRPSAFHPVVVFKVFGPLPLCASQFWAKQAPNAGGPEAHRAWNFPRALVHFRSPLCDVWVPGLGTSTRSPPILGSGEACGGNFPNKQLVSVPSLRGVSPRRGCPWRGPGQGAWVPALPSVFQAGLASPENSEQLIVALEPEAASIYCRKLRLHQMIELSSKAAVNGYSASDTVGAGFAQGTSCSLSPPPCCLPSSPLHVSVPWSFKGTQCGRQKSRCF